MNPGATKRQKELARKQRQRDKAARRDARKEARKVHDAEAPLREGEDPDIAGIVPGPQPISLE
jgi:hypothetical protein